MAAFTYTTGSTSTQTATSNTQAAYMRSPINFGLISPGLNYSGAMSNATVITGAKPIFITSFSVSPLSGFTGSTLQLATGPNSGTIDTGLSGDTSYSPDAFIPEAYSTIYYGWKNTTNPFQLPVQYGLGTSTVSLNGTYTNGVSSSTKSIRATFSWYGVPGAPYSPTVVATSSSSVTLAWTRNGDMGGYSSGTGYRILYRADSASTWSTTGPFGGDSSVMQTITGLKPGVTYHFRIAARNTFTDTYSFATGYSQMAIVGTNASISATTKPSGVYTSPSTREALIVKVWNGTVWSPATLKVRTSWDVWEAK